jgi:glycosyltransferase involved in cell wall biosynthesis
MTIHLVYPFGDRRAAPWSIGNHLGEAILQAGHTLEIYDWKDRVRMDCGHGDILIGHPCEEPGYAFTDNLFLGWDKIIIIAPWNGSELYTDRIDQAWHIADTVIPICGPYWADRLPGHWEAHPVDMAVDARDYPFLKEEIAPRGMRRILYIGCTVPAKGTDFLTQLTRALPDVEFGHVGPGIVPGCWPWGPVAMETETGQEIVKRYDFLIAPGRNDANPATALEAKAWGLIPITTPQSGWDNSISIPLDDVQGAVTVIQKYLDANEEMLRTIQQENLKQALEVYTWRRFCKHVLQFI